MFSCMAVLVMMQVMGKGPINHGANLGLAVCSGMFLAVSYGVGWGWATMWIGEPLHSFDMPKKNLVCPLPESVRSLDQCLHRGDSHVLLIFREDGRLVTKTAGEWRHGCGRDWKAVISILDPK